MLDGVGFWRRWLLDRAACRVLRRLTKNDNWRGGGDIAAGKWWRLQRLGAGVEGGDEDRLVGRCWRRLVHRRLQHCGAE